MTSRRCLVCLPRRGYILRVGEKRVGARRETETAAIGARGGARRRIKNVLLLLLGSYLVEWDVAILIVIYHS